MRLRPIVFALAFAAGSLGANLSHAGLILNFQNVLPAGAQGGTITIQNLSPTSQSLTSYNVSAGMLSFKQKIVGTANYLDDLLTSFCIEPKTSLIRGDTLFQTGTLADRLAPLVSRLYDLHYATAMTLTGGAAAFQLALWEIVSDSNALELDSGVFRAGNNFGESKALATTWLTELSNWSSNPDSDSYTSSLYEFKTLTAGNSQDQLTVTRKEQQVPEPGVLALLGIGAIAGLMGRRRKSV